MRLFVIVSMVALLSARKGFFVVLDGIDGCGKTVHAKVLCRQLRERNYDVTYTSEPSRSPIGQFIGQKFLRESKVAPEIETLLFAADRFHHLSKEVIPSLNANKIVVSDRYIHASLAYQGAQGLKLEWIRQVNNFVIKPDLAIYLDAPAEIGLARKRSRSTLENLDLEKKVRQVYLDLVKSGELTKIDSNRHFDLVKRDILTLVLQALERTHFSR